MRYQAKLWLEFDANSQEEAQNELDYVYDYLSDRLSVLEGSPTASLALGVETSVNGPEAVDE